MSDNWSVIKEEVTTYRNYVKNLPSRAAAGAKHSYLLTKEEIDRLLALKGEGATLHGIRIYLGANIIENHMVPAVHVVAVEKEGEEFTDFNVPKAAHHAAGAQVMMASAPAGGGSTGNPVPCPPTCNVTNNILNS